jgi:hypothetical protein
MLALGVGILTGIGSSSGPGTDDGRGVGPGDARLSRLASGADDVVAEGFGALVSGTLDGRAVTVVSLGPAAAPVARSVVSDLGTAGAEVGGPVLLDEAWVDPGAADLRDGLAAQSATGESPDRSTASLGGDGPAGELAGELAAVLTGSGGDEAGSSVRGLLTGAGLVSGPLPVPAPVLVLVAPVTAPTGEATAWAGFAADMDAVAPPGGGAVVVAAGSLDDPQSTTERSVVVALRDSAAVTTVPTVDHIATGLGRVAMVRVVAAVPLGDVGHYGWLRGAESGTPAGR